MEELTRASSPPAIVSPEVDRLRSDTPHAFASRKQLRRSIRTPKCAQQQALVPYSSPLLVDIQQLCQHSHPARTQSMSRGDVGFISPRHDALIFLTLHISCVAYFILSFPHAEAEQPAQPVRQALDSPPYCYSQSLFRAPSVAVTERA